MKLENEKLEELTIPGETRADIESIHTELVETWVSALRARLPQLCACAVVMDGESYCFQWHRDDMTLPNLSENLLGSANLSRRSKTPITTHDRRFLTVAVKIMDISPTSTAMGSVCVMLEGPESLRDQVIAELERAAVWFCYLYQKFAAKSLLKPEDLLWLEPLVGTAIHPQTAKPIRLFDRLVSTTNNLVSLVAADRVAIGLVGTLERTKKVRRVAVSGPREFPKRSPLQRRLCDTMCDTLAQWQLDDEIEPRITDHGLTLQVPVREGTDVIGVLLVDRRDGRKFSDEEISGFVIKGRIFGAFVGLRRRAERDPLNALEHATNRILPSTITRKILYALLVAAIVAGTLIPLPHNISADAVIEGEQQRSLVAPLDTYLEHVHVEAGSKVLQGDLLASFATEDLSLELLKWQSERARKQKEKRDLAARQERSKLRVLEAEIAQANAEIALVETRIAKSKLFAPVDGVIVSGDLSQRLGAPVERGEMLFEIVPNGDYQVMLLLDEQQVRNVQTGNAAHLKLNAFPGQTVPLEVFRITPVNEVNTSGNYFVAYARLLEQQIVLRPGMQGIAKIEVGTRPAFINWTDSFNRWASLKAWQWLGLNFGD